MFEMPGRISLPIRHGTDCEHFSYFRLGFIGRAGSGIGSITRSITSYFGGSNFRTKNTPSQIPVSSTANARTVTVTQYASLNLTDNSSVACLAALVACVTLVRILSIACRACSAAPRPCWPSAESSPRALRNRTALARFCAPSGALSCADLRSAVAADQWCVVSPNSFRTG